MTLALAIIGAWLYGNLTFVAGCHWASRHRNRRGRVDFTVTVLPRTEAKPEAKP